MLVSSSGGPMRRAGRGDFHLLRPAPPLEVGVDHIALDRPGADNRHLDHQIIEAARAQPRQHVHLRPAFDLEHPQRIALAQHVVNLGILARDRRERQRLAVMCAQQIEAFADAGQHPQRQNIDLEDAERVDIVLVPFDETALGHRAVADRHGLGQRALRQDKPADVLRKVALACRSSARSARAPGARADRRGRSRFRARHALP